jgi:hypothetical protein
MSGENWLKPKVPQLEGGNPPQFCVTAYRRDLPCARRQLANSGLLGYRQRR